MAYRDRGVFLVFLAICLVVLIAFVGLVIGLAILATDSTRVQQTADLAALRALKGYIDAGGSSPVPSPSPRANSARDDANGILARNTIFGVPTFGTLGLPWDSPTGNDIDFGTWYETNPCPSCSPPPVCSPFPCYIPWGPNTNAARVTLRAIPFVDPFFKLFSSSSHQLTETSIAAASSQCGAFVIDISVSSMEETHLYPYLPTMADVRRRWNQNTDTPPALPPACTQSPNPSAAPPNYILCPEATTYGMFAFHKNNLRLFNATFPAGGQGSSPMDPRYFEVPLGSGLTPACMSSASELFFTPDGNIWCSVVAENGGLRRRDSMGKPGHFQQDYQEMNTIYGIKWVDKHTVPEPLGSFLLASNAAIRVMQQQSTPSDNVMISGFASVTRTKFPIGTAVTNDLRFVQQLTDYTNIGTLAGVSGDPTPIPTFNPAVSPNYVEAGFFPDPNSANGAASHIVKALSEAINNLMTGCPDESKKFIFLFTDGVATCANGLSPECPNTRAYSTYSTAYSQLLLDSDPNSIINQLRQNEIVLHVVLSGAGVEPNFKNIDDGNGGYVSYEQAQAQGDLTFFQGGYSGATSLPDAYIHYGEPGVVFREPIKDFGELSMKSGGYFCPLMPLCLDTDCAAAGCPGGVCYDATTGDLCPLMRPYGSIQKCAIKNLSKGQQAAACAEIAVGRNPYMLVRE